MVNLFVANTDNAWFDFLSAEQNITEVNFWWPGELGFGAIQPGELLVFRLKSPRNKIGGFGVFSSYSLLPMQLAWDSFGRANGVLSFDKLRNAIADYRPGTTVGPMTNIGCTILVEPVFLPPIFGSTFRHRGRVAFSAANCIQRKPTTACNSGTACMMQRSRAPRRFPSK